MRDVSDGKSELDDGLDKKGNRRDFRDDFSISSLRVGVYYGFNCVPSKDML